ncbi:MAG: radical SAM protein [Archangium sp.]|nr:radical SAM protein [Archangium sp.]
MASTRHQLLEGLRTLQAAEQGTLFKQARLNVAMCYPSPYHVGMSSLGFQTIYREVHAHPEATAERVFLPDDVDAWRAAKVMPSSIETQRPLDQFQVLAFSVAYELEVTGLFELLESSGFPALREQRSESMPLVVAGGPLTFSNPDPLEPFVDVLLQGEAEDLVAPLLEAVLAGGGKQAVLARLANVPGFRVPGMSAESTRGFVFKATDLRLPAYSQIVTQNTELRGMFLIEPERGCSRGCHYCVMRRTTNGGMRTVPPERVLSLIPAGVKRVGLVGAAVTDHPKIVELLETLARDGKEVGISSLRADRLTPRLVAALKACGAQVLTVASDGPSQRLRDLVDRKHSELQIVNAATMAKAAGFKRLKVYNVIGLPTETDEDIDELVRFTLELSRILPVALGVAPFAAKRNTPLDGAPFAGIDVVDKRLERLRRGLKGRAELRPTSARWAWVEYVMAQCGPEAGLAAYDAWKAGGAFAAWKKAFAARDLRPFEARRTPDGRRNAVAWPTVGRKSGPLSMPEGTEGLPAKVVSDWGPLDLKDRGASPR